MNSLIFTMAAFALILILARIKVPLTLAILAGAIALGALFRLSASTIAWAAWEGITKPSTIGLSVITVLLLAVSELMARGEQLKEIVALFRAFLRRPAVAMAALPALIGLLPMPGGALFSAPMVKAAAGDSDENPGRLSAINYWYRHIWEHWWPLYPGVLLAITHTGLGMGTFILRQLPLGIIMAVAGLVIYRGSQPNLHVSSQPPAKGTKRKLFVKVSSIWLILVVWGLVSGGIHLVEYLSAGSKAAADAAGGQGNEWLGALRKYGPLTLGLIASFLWTVRLNRLPAMDLVRVLGDKKMYKLVGLILSIMVFQQILKESDAARKMVAEMQSLHISPLVIVMFLPAISGLVTGVAVGFVGVSFPIVLSVVGQMESGAAACMVLAYACGHLGMMLSPIHLCHVVSNRFFNTAFGPVYRWIVPAVVITFLLEVAYVALLAWLIG